MTSMRKSSDKNGLKECEIDGVCSIRYWYAHRRNYNNEFTPKKHTYLYRKIEGNVFRYGIIERYRSAVSRTILEVSSDQSK